MSNIITTKDFAISKEIEEENVGLATIDLAFWEVA
jgi:hypothetical protein|tara:strand:- start:6125 stop:6229 length:105 start_codon:yes stop_codon:yes gene_type:complete